MISLEEVKLNILKVFRSSLKIQDIVKCEIVMSSLLEFSTQFFSE